MYRVILLVLYAALLASVSVSAAAEIKAKPPGIPAPTVVPPDWQDGTHRLWSRDYIVDEFREFSMSTRDNPAECRLACERSSVCAAWTMIRAGAHYPGTSLSQPQDMCSLQATSYGPVKKDPCCVSGLRRSPLPSVPEHTGPGETYEPNAVHLNWFRTFYMTREATWPYCRAACLEYNAAGAYPTCAYATFHRPGVGGTMRLASVCHFSGDGAIFERREAWSTTGPVR
jgi:hypothetical protein